MRKTGSAPRARGKRVGPRRADEAGAGIDVVRMAAGDHAASIFAVLLTMAFEATMEIVAFARLAGLDGDAHSLLETLRRADAAFGDVFGCRMFDDILGSKARPGADRPEPTHVAMSRGLASLIAWDAGKRPDGNEAPRPDVGTLRWVEIASAAARTGRGHHLMLRAQADAIRSASDYASMCAAYGARTAYLAGMEPMAAAILGAELYGPGIVVVVDGTRIVTGEKGGDPDSWYDVPASPASASTLDATAFAAAAVAWLPKLTNVYVWRIPAGGALPAFLTGIVGGCIDCVAYERTWKTRQLRALAPELGSDGLRALHALHPDPRDARPVIELAVAAGTAAGATIDEACAFLARSVGGREPEMRDLPHFDERLLADGDCRTLFERAEALGEGGRVLFHGAPGGGKSALAKAIALKVDPERPVLPIAPAHFLMKGWGAMERRLTALFDDAAAKGAIILADELGSLCPTRDGDPHRHGNALLAQSLTDEWLRLLDAHPRLVVLATVNDLAFVDAAVRRRFQTCVHVAPELDPRRERIAWDAIFAVEPPKGWMPCGASISDFASAAERCRLLGRGDAASLAAAVRIARDLRADNVRRPPTRGTAH